ncbi:MAG: hypothetical protein HeimC2_22980 [Candidatus Heimdallarchaeota archaeon LC_2]|nr:MAG: hypothetical protein HeimC2_22980 [Candidatus Heimdallarchaeota archaeon LC_2]
MRNNYKQQSGLGLIFIIFFIIFIQLMAMSDITLADNPREINEENSIDSLLPLWTDIEIGTQKISIHLTTLIVGLALMVTIFGVIHLTNGGKADE